MHKEMDIRTCHTKGRLLRFNRAKAIASSFQNRREPGKPNRWRSGSKFKLGAMKRSEDLGAGQGRREVMEVSSVSILIPGAMSSEAKAARAQSLNENGCLHAWLEYCLYRGIPKMEIRIPQG